MASVKVAVRVRPFNKRELSMGSKLVVDVQGNQVNLAPPPPSTSSTPTQSKASTLHGGDRVGAQKFTFDYSYWSHNPDDDHFAGQEKVFDDLGVGVVENAFNGYNVCVFAYGQTGSGKTYTMMGSDDGENDDGDESCNSSSKDMGLIPRICRTLFSKMQASDGSYRTEASYLEIYNEHVKDLLGSDSNPDHRLKVREHPKEGPYVQNLSKHLVMDYSEIRTLMERGNSLRTTAATNMNDTSSRSHAIFTVTFTKASICDGLPQETVSKIHLVDLAGSERANASGATGQRLKEGGHINKSLVTLGSVISALAEARKPKKETFIPYRDSVLTWLLKDSLGGNSKTIMIATISPAEINHNETLSTLRYANRAKNIINKPTVNEDPNVKLIRELRAEIDRLRGTLQSTSDVNQIDSNTRQKLAVKEAQERHLTEEWTEKWKEAAKILDEHKALALKQTGLGVSLDSDKPHLVGIDEDVLSTGITLYHLKDGDTRIGSHVSSNDIVLNGIEDRHCVVNLKDGIATLIPQSEDAVCTVNAVIVVQSTRLFQGCVVVLGKTHMFRYNDPTEAANMRLNLSNHNNNCNNNNNNNTIHKHNSGVNGNHFQQSLLSQSLSDLRLSSPSAAMVAAMAKSDPGKSSTPLRKQRVENDNCDDDEASIIVSSSERLASPDSINTMTPTSSQGSSDENHSAEMSKLYEAINEQKDIIVKCLDSEQCEVGALNEQLSLLQDMQRRYSKMEFEQARNLWMAGIRNLGDEADYEARFSSLVEQEVERRLFQEKVLKAETEFQEKELWRMERDRQIASLRRQHEREVYVLKRKMHDQEVRRTNQSPNSDSNTGACRVFIPSFVLSGRGSASHVEYRVDVMTSDSFWTVMRRFRKFRDLHVSLAASYGPLVSSLPFPSRRLFGNRSDQVSHERQARLNAYLNILLLTLAKIESSPIYNNPTREALIRVSPAFFNDDDVDVVEASDQSFS